ncbi:MAG TPA: molybdopterin molybdotransferase MoeA [bacterium]|nr:molybdopterin molybdotransferase MoeA [bacterium]
MIHPDEAVAMMAGFLRSPKVEAVPLASALGRIIMAPITGTMDQPPFNKSAVDGWAWKAEGDQSMPTGPLRVRGVLAAGRDGLGGQGTDAPLESGETVRIMTGAPVPHGATRVHSFELAAEANGLVTFSRPERISNIIHQGENSRTGDQILSTRLLSAQDLAILAADGRATVDVAVRPLIGVLSTGAELLEPGMPRSGAMIYDSNRPQILAQLASPAFQVRDLGHLPDDFAATLAAVRSALDVYDVLLLSGGVSMGDFDYVPKALAAAGATTRFHGVAMKPGKPTYFGTTDRAFVIGLPGNPVSVFVNTEVLVKTLLFALSGAPYRPLLVPVPMAQQFRRKSTERVEFIPVRIDADGAHPVRYGGSSAIQALGMSDGFVRLEIGQDGLEMGAITHVRLVR